MLICRLYILLDKMSLLIFCPFSIWLFNFFTVELWEFIFSRYWSFSVMWFENIFSNLSLSFYPLNGVFYEAKIFIVMKTNLSIFLYELWFVVNSRNSLHRLRSQRHCSMLFSGSILVLCYILVCDHFELILCNMCDTGQNSL